MSREVIIDAAARALFVCAYADHCEECEGCGDEPTHHVARNGADWMDTAPATPERARVLARELIWHFEKRNALAPVEYVFHVACALPGHRKKPTASDFGHYLAMQALGHGVTWEDDHPAHGYIVPHIEGLVF